MLQPETGPLNHLRLIVDVTADLTDPLDIQRSVKALEVHQAQLTQWKRKLLGDERKLRERRQKKKINFGRKVTRMDLQKVADELGINVRVATTVWHRMIGYRLGDLAAPLGVFARKTARELLDERHFTLRRLELLVAFLATYGTEIGAAAEWPLPDHLKDE